MSVQLITADMLTAARVISNLATASVQQKCMAVEAIAAKGTPVDELTVRELMDIAMRSAPQRNGTASMVATTTAPQRARIVRLLEGAGIDAATVHDGLSEILERARVQLPRGIRLEQALRGISHTSGARLIQAIRAITVKEPE